MKQQHLTFEEYPLHIPSEKKVVKKLESLIQELEE